MKVRFAVADATKLEGYTNAFDTVIDSGMYHCLDDDGKRSYAAAVHRATRPGATLLLGAFSDANAEDREWPRPMVSEQSAARDPWRCGLGHHLADVGHRAASARRHRSGDLARASATTLTTLMQRDRHHAGA